MFQFNLLQKSVNIFVTYIFNLDYNVTAVTVELKKQKNTFTTTVLTISFLAVNTDQLIIDVHRNHHKTGQHILSLTDINSNMSKIASVTPARSRYGGVFDESSSRSVVAAAFPQEGL